jgi:hypothetical protein
MTADRSEEARCGVKKPAASAFDELRLAARGFDVRGVETVAISTARGAGILACHFWQTGMSAPHF